MNRYFESNRFWLLLKLELFKSRKGIIMTIVIIFGMSFFLGMILDLWIEPTTLVFDHREGYAFSLILGGFILSSLSFHGLRNRLNRYQFLMVPVSALERFLVMWLMTTIGWVVLFTAMFTVYTIFANTIGQLLFGHVKFNAFQPFGIQPITAIKYYVVTQGVFLAGAVYFRAFVFPKMLVTLIIIAIVAGTTGYLILKDVFLMDHYCEGAECELLDEMGVHSLWHAARVFFWWGLAPLSWLVTYFGLKDQEV